jgi:superfamily II DNA or RNA helicase
MATGLSQRPQRPQRPHDAIARGSPLLLSASDKVRRSFDPAVVARGELYAMRGFVTVLGGTADRVAAIVRGTLPYDVTIRHERREREGFLVASCTCAHAARHMCKHVWAALRVAERGGHLEGAAGEGKELRIVPAAPDFADEQPRSQIRWLIDLAKGTPYADLPVEVFERSTLPLGFSTGFRAVPLAQRTFERAAPGKTALEVLALARTGRCDVVIERGRPPEPLVADEGEPFRVVLVVRETTASSSAMPGLRVYGELRRGDEIVALDAVTAVFYIGLAFVGARAVSVERDVPFRWVLSLRERNEMLVDPEDSLRFLRELVTKCTRTSFVLPESIAIEENAAFRTHVHVRKPHPEGGSSPLRSLPADVTFDYDGATARWRDRGSLAFDVARRRIVVRDRDREQRAVAEILSAGFDRKRSRDEDRAFKIPPSRLTSAILALPGERFVVEADGVLHRRATTAKLSVISGIDWFDLNAKVDFDGRAVPCPLLLEAAMRRERLVRLDDGSMGILPTAWLERLARVMGLAGGGENASGGESEGESESGVRLRFRRSQIALVDAMLGDEGGNVAWEGPLASLRTQLAGFVELPLADPPRAFRGELRDYQRAGLAWMQWLERIGFSGCLADDMGLGKTVQVLALLAGRRERPRAATTSLVVAPRSVVYNWIDEARRFVPELRVTELTSTTPRDEALASDLLVTTYGILRRRADLARMPLDYVILDEAHAIKNARASTSSAAQRLRSSHRLALTGTPVENHLGELASLFDFLNPGILGPSVRKAARRSLELAPEDASRLGRGLRPFVLRRKKADVLSELPPRIDQTIVCEMEAPERAVYDRVKEHYRSLLLGKIEEEGVDAARFHVFSALLRLRQLACHPGLVDPARRDQRSAKLDALVEHLEPVVRQSKKALVFSQFTSLLDIVGRELDARRITHARLDGSTPNRREVVARFQDDAACSVFLVSLKAGGVGLNLTAAEYVFILDPWWNPAAEAQAVDRAHRMGQTRTVVAYRLLCKDTIEERVAELQEKKRRLVSSIFAETEGPRLGALSAQDVEALLS